jgi:hypothetical protein
VTEERTESFNYRQYNATFIDLAIHLGFIGILVSWTFLLVHPFIPIIVWSVVLTVALYPVFDWLAAVLGGRRGLGAALITILGLLVVIGPVTWLGLGLIDGLKTLVESPRLGEIDSSTFGDHQGLAACRAAALRLLGARIDQCAKCANPPPPAVGATWANLAQRGERRGHLDAEVPRLRDHRGILVFNGTAASHGDENARAQDRLDARREVREALRRHHTRGVARGDWHFVVGGGSRRNRNVLGWGSRRKRLDARHLGARNNSNRPVDHRGSAPRVELDDDDNGTRAGLHGLHGYGHFHRQFLEALRPGARADDPDAGDSYRRHRRRSRAWDWWPVRRPGRPRGGLGSRECMDT